MKTPFQAKLITPAGVVTPIQPKKDNSFSLKELQDYVGGYIQILNTPNNTGAILVINEEGKLLGLPYNEIASILWREGTEPNSPRSLDYVVGNVVLCHSSQVE